MGKHLLDWDSRWYICAATDVGSSTYICRKHSDCALCAHEYSVLLLPLYSLPQLLLLLRRCLHFFAYRTWPWINTANFGFCESRKFIVHLCKKIINFMAASLIIAERISFRLFFLFRPAIQAYDMDMYVCIFFSLLHFVNRRRSSAIEMKAPSDFRFDSFRFTTGSGEVGVREYRNTRDNFQNAPTTTHNPFQGHARTQLYALPLKHSHSHTHTTQNLAKIIQKLTINRRWR